MSAIFIFFIVLVPYIIYTIHHYYSTVSYITSRRIIFLQQRVYLEIIAERFDSKILQVFAL